MYIPHTTHVAPYATIHRERVLPQPGQVIVQGGEQVSANDVLARAELTGRHQILDIARFFGVPREEVAKLLLVEQGDKVKRREPLAAKSTLLGLVRRRARSPFAGRVVAIGDGRILLAARAGVFELRAGMPGTVIDVVHGLGAVIESTGALIQGAWGSGRQEFGVVRVATALREEPLTAELLDDGYQGALTIAGATIDEAGLRAAARVKVRGLVVAGLSATLVPLVRKLQFPLMLTEGFGQRVMPEHTWSIIQSNNGREAMLAAVEVNPYAQHRPELFVFLPAGMPPPPMPLEGEPLRVGKRVRVIRPPHLGQIGTIVRLSDYPQLITTGIHTLTADVAIDGNQTVAVPLANLEIFEQLAGERKA